MSSRAHPPARAAAGLLAPLAALLLGALFGGAGARASELFPDSSSLVKPGMTQESVNYGGIARSWWRFLPASHDYNRPCPLMIVLHGGFSSALGMSSLTEHGFERIADTEHTDMVVVYPESVDKNWHDDRASIDSTAVTANIDDVGFIRSVIRQTENETPIDTKRIFVTGISNGAMMCYRLARELPDTFAVIAPVAGLLPVEARDLPWPQTVSVILFAGTEDPLMPYNGGPVGSPSSPRGEVLSVNDTIGFLLAQDHLVDQNRELPSGEHISDGTTTWRARAYGLNQCEVDFYEIIGGGHTWPGGRQLLLQSQVGRTCTSLDACQVIWNFCRLHPHP